MDLNRGLSSLMFGVSLVSIFFCIPACASYFTFVEIRKKAYYKVIFFLNLSVMLSHFGSMLGEPHDKTFACWYTGITINIFTLASVFWTVVVSHMLNSIVVNEKQIKLDYKHHLLCWIVPMFLTLIPILRMNYGSSEEGMGRCWIVPRKSTPISNQEIHFWNYFNFYVPLWSGYFVIVYLNLQTARNLDTIKMCSTYQSVRSILIKLRYYPWVIVISWLFNTIAYNYADDSHEFKGRNVYMLLMQLFPCCQGTLTGMVFIFTCEEIRGAWYIYFKTKDLQLASNQLFENKSRLSSPKVEDDIAFNSKILASNMKGDSDKSTSSSVNFPKILPGKIYIQEFFSDDENGTDPGVVNYGG